MEQRIIQHSPIIAPNKQAADLQSDIQPDSMIPRQSSPVRLGASDASGVERLKRQLTLENQTILQLNHNISELHAENLEVKELEAYREQAKQKEFENAVLQRKILTMQEEMQQLENKVAQFEGIEAERQELVVEHKNAVLQLNEETNMNMALRSSLEDVKKDIECLQSKIAKEADDAIKANGFERQIKELLLTNSGLVSRGKELERGYLDMEDHIVILETENQQLREQILEENGVLQQAKLDSSLEFLDSNGPEDAQTEIREIREQVVRLQRQVLAQEATLEEKDETIRDMRSEVTKLEGNYKILLDKQSVNRQRETESMETSLAESRSGLLEMGEIVDRQKRQLELYENVVSREPDTLSLIEQALEEGERCLNNLACK